MSVLLLWERNLHAWHIPHSLTSSLSTLLIAAYETGVGSLTLAAHPCLLWLLTGKQQPELCQATALYSIVFESSSEERPQPVPYLICQSGFQQMRSHPSHFLGAVKHVRLLWCVNIAITLSDNIYSGAC